MSDKTRISRHRLFMSIAESFAKRGTCQRAQVGVVIVDRLHHIVSHGYNGSPPGLPHCLDVGCGGGIVTGVNPEDNLDIVEYPNGCTRTTHAEANAIAYAARVGAKLGLTTMYSTHEPCPACAKLIAAAGIKSVFYIHAHRDPGREILLKSGVMVEALPQP